MVNFSDIHRVVMEAHKSGRIGQPVFARLLVGFANNPPDSLSLASRWVAAVATWMGDSVASLHGMSTGNPSVLTVAVQFRRGGTALISGSAPETSPPSFDLILLGNHGSMMYEGIRSGLTQLLDPGEAVRAETVKALSVALDQSLKRGAPQMVPEGLE
jgi:hypothetical protein